MPNSREISDEQQDIFEDAPTKGSILISGPPGTGKTVIAFMRAELLAKKVPVKVLMYNRVLRRYTENVAATIEGNVSSKTMHIWFPEWWRAHQIAKPNTENAMFIEGGLVLINCPYEEKNAAKALGAQWVFGRKNPYSGANGMWGIPQTIFQKNPDDYSRWTGVSYDPLTIAPFQFDWEQMRGLYQEIDDENCLDWGHLIIDEAQDFEPSCFKFLHTASKQLDHGGLTILADENQRLEEERHSSLNEIRSALKLKNKPEREFQLTVNFRNTLEIAQMAAHFYVGLDTGKAKLPKRRGNTPEFYQCRYLKQQIDHICNFLNERAALEVGVIFDNDADKAYFHQQLEQRLSQYRIQNYSSSDYQSSETLEFDTPGTVTLLHRKSCKGLEFDVVFVPQLQNFSVSDSDTTTFKMNMYVICSRARHELIFLTCGGKDANPEFFDLFPALDSGLIDYKEFG